ncbi:hypothetical protein ALQ33_200047 [Pseudomonas syringae pv. philadelphi]|uniref:Uncharacterized protein n=1 Tax=Pseudomonas syringae pv. philadelphi TaxID=251706 RepID=A0A3M3Z5D1_9PSED|nr:hypothetical protein [Pseudomonas syringae group genomosp. 3]RMO89711.1 hypothetical protein ALQ33_200047 [Pseudomonas syringae pv. philadelphi]
MANLKIIFAYCEELGRSVSIDEARAYYFSQTEKNRLTFSCSDRTCKVSVTGINYDKKAEDGKKFLAAHYRAHKVHKQECEWIKYTTDQQADRKPEETLREFETRKMKAKLKDSIDIFAPSDDNDLKRLDESNTKSPTHSSSSASGRKPANPNNRISHTQTNQLQRLTDYWRDAQDKLSESEFKKLDITIKGSGRTRLSEYFAEVKTGLTTHHKGVYYADALPDYISYGAGFKLTFHDAIDQKTIHLYIPAQLMKSSSRSHYIKEVIKTKNIDHFKIFALSPKLTELTNREGKTSITLEITDLSRLAIYFKQNTNPE